MRELGAQMTAAVQTMAVAGAKATPPALAQPLARYADELLTISVAMTTPLQRLLDEQEQLVEKMADWAEQHRHLSEQIADFDPDFFDANGHHRKVDGYQVVDLRAGVDFGRFSVEAYTKNLFNSHGRTSTTGTDANGLPLYPNGAIGTGVIRPRVIGLSLTAGL